jgi:hypothetical protein
MRAPIDRLLSGGDLVTRNHEIECPFMPCHWRVHVDSAAQAGDLVTWTVPPNLPHIMVVSDRKNADLWRLIIHNIGCGTQEEDSLFEFGITGHYRIPKAESGRECVTGFHAQPRMGSGAKEENEPL